MDYKIISGSQCIWPLQHVGEVMDEQIGGLDVMLVGGWSHQGRVNYRAEEEVAEACWLADITPG